VVSAGRRIVTRAADANRALDVPRGFCGMAV